MLFQMASASLTLKSVKQPMPPETKAQIRLFEGLFGPDPRLYILNQPLFETAFTKSPVNIEVVGRQTFTCINIVENSYSTTLKALRETHDL